MAYALGIALFAFGIFFSVCLHEAGHMLTAKAFGMKVTRYFAGFGPTLFSVKRGETEYGLKAIPAGGFVKIVGMTPLDDDVDAADEPRAFWRKPLWQRTVVLSAGSITHFILGIILLYVCALWIGLPNPALRSYDVMKAPAVVGETSNCVPLTYDADDPQGVKCDGKPVGPAKAGGLEPGDTITAFNGVRTESYGELVDRIRGVKAAAATVTYERNGRPATADVELINAQRLVGGTKESPKLEKRWTLGVTPKGFAGPTMVQYGAGEALGPTFGLTGDIFSGTFTALKKFPEKVPKLIDALTGSERDPETPISVVGASVIGGEAAERDRWEVFVLMLAGLNIFIGVFNLFPLLPLDGGHIAIAWFERVRSIIAARRGRPDPGRVDYTKLMPLTYAVILIFGGITILTLATDIVNPISLFGR